jgi:pimeloyl-ACP methyl ester carboxylesterase
MAYTMIAAPVAGGDLHGGRWTPAAPIGPTVLAVHGVTASHRCWSSLASRAPDLDIVAPDLRGRGRSNGLPGPAGLRQHADDLARLLDHLGLEAVVVLGHSMGALASVVFADRHPDRVERLVLVDGGLPLEPLPGMTPDETMDATLGPAVARLSMTFPTREAYQEFWREHPAFAGGISPAMADYFDYDLVETVGGYRSGVNPDLFRDDVLSQLDPETLTPALERLSVPASFVWAPRGLLDQPEPLYPRDFVDQWDRRLPLLTVVDVDDVNHYTIVFDDRPLDVIAAELRSPTQALEDQ